MKISLNTYKPVYSGFKSANTNEDKEKERQILHSKTKRVVSECTTVAVAAGILYFAMKSNLMKNAVKKDIAKAQKIARLKMPEIILPNPLPDVPL